MCGCAGANVDVDISCKYLSFFMDDDERLEEIKTAYGKGELLTGEVKAELITVSLIQTST